MDPRTLILGDVHGHYDRLEALLKQEGIIGRCPECDGFGDLPTGECDPGDMGTVECANCHGDGIARIDKDVFVVQVGDLGHFGATGSPTGDLLCWRAAYNGWIDVVLWGNHDRALVDETRSAFRGYMRPRPDTLHYVNGLYSQGRLMMAWADHGYLITHAGLHVSFKHADVPANLKEDPQAFADWINDADEQYLEAKVDNLKASAVRDPIGAVRGGRSQYGGLLWRDYNERLFTGYPQIFGHSKGDRVRREDTPLSHYCIDVGSEHNGRLAGIYLPTMEVVEVNLNRNNLANSINSPQEEVVS